MKNRKEISDYLYFSGHQQKILEMWEDEVYNKYTYFGLKPS